MDKIALITGAGRGLGRELALTFAENGYDIFLQGRDKKNLENVSAQINSIGKKTWILEGDVRDNKVIEEIFRNIKEKNIGLLINNAGAPSLGIPFEQETDEQLTEVITTNLLSQIKLINKVYRIFLERNNGGIININSILGLESKALRAVYCASRWGSRGFNESLKKEIGEKPIRIMDVYPTRIKTKPEYTKGMEVKYVAEKVYDSYVNSKVNELILDDRPKK
ncbi:MAG: SDR family NAD(P)-dependent oxidoreductase [Nanoarchaeota archaeon]|nr:SDR family NAD(P)-dependent oxidoreductase [Nanoarchaeota archaeon]